MDAHEQIRQAIDRYREKAVAISHEIHEHPELKFQERFASGSLTAAARGLGLEVASGVGGLETAFRAEFGTPGPTVAILAEYDALPNGHSCGHNLIAGAALSAIAGLSAIGDRLPGRIVFLGTPAEEGGAGKVILLNKGEFRGVDAALMAHPTNHDYSTMPALATSGVKLTFHGRAAHAAMAPWDGSSALSAMIQTFVAIDAMRLHLRDGSRLHGIITNGGQIQNIIPATTEAQFSCRGRTSRYAEEVARRVVRCAEGAAVSTGTKVEHQMLGGYKNMIANLSIASRYSAHCESLGTPSPEAPDNLSTGSTDMGDVSHALPAIHPVFAIARHGEGTCHEDAFVQHADSPRGYDAMIRVGKALALTAYDLLAEPALLKSAKDEFARREES